MKRLKVFLRLILKDLSPRSFDDLVCLIFDVSLIPLVFGIIMVFFNTWLASIIILTFGSIDAFVFCICLIVNVFKYLENKWGESKL